MGRRDMEACGAVRFNFAALRKYRAVQRRLSTPGRDFGAAVEHWSVWGRAHRTWTYGVCEVDERIVWSMGRASPYRFCSMSVRMLH